MSRTHEADFISAYFQLHYRHSFRIRKLGPDPRAPANASMRLGGPRGSASRANEIHQIVERGPTLAVILKCACLLKCRKSL